MNYKKTISYILIILIVLLITTACDTENIIKEIPENIVDEDIEYEPIEGGGIVIPLTNLITLNPLMTENISYFHFSKLIFEGMFELGTDLNISPKLADSYIILDDGKTVEIKLKRDVKWHDDQEFTTADVAFTINVLKYAKDISTYNNMFQSAQGIFGQSDINTIKDIKIIDDYNIQLSFKDIASNNLELLTFPIIPQHIFKGEGNSLAKALEIENYVPIGTGPYKFNSYEKMKNIYLIAFDSYRNGKPYITNIDGKVLEDNKLILTAFETGQLSIASTLGVDWEKYNSNKRIKTIEFVSNDYEFIGFNFEKEIFQGESGLAIRKAINYGIDRQAIIRKIYLGHGIQIDVPIHPDSWLISPDANSYGYNIEKSRDLLKAVGWIDRDEDGILEDENGEKLVLKILTNSYNQLRLNTTEMIVGDLKKLGFSIELDFENNQVEVATEEQILLQWEELNTKIDQGDFDLTVLGWEMSIIPDLSLMFHSTELTDNGNFISYKNEIMDSLLLNIHESSTREEKKESYSKLQEFIVEDIPYVSLFYKNRALLVDSKIKGDLNPTFFNPYNGLEDCFIPENLQ